MDQDNSNLQVNNSVDWIDQVYRQHGKFIESVIFFAAGKSQEADDIYQEVFMALIKMKGIDQIKDLRNYLYILTLNKVHEYRQKQLRGKQVLKEYAKTVVASGVSEEHPAFVKEEADKMLAKIRNCLSEKESEAVLLRFRQMVDNDQAAQTMNVNKATFLRYVSVGVKKLRAIVRSSQEAEG